MDSNEEPRQIPEPALPQPSARQILTDAQLQIFDKILESPIPIVVSESTVNRRLRVKNIVTELLKRDPSTTPIHMMAFFQRAYKASTAFTYIVTMAQLFPHFKKSPGWKDHMRAAELDANKEEAFAEQADFCTVEKMMMFTKDMKAHNNTLRILILFVWLTASRHGDLKHMMWIPDAERHLIHKDHEELTVGVVDLKGSKGDKSGKRGDTKAILFPTKWIHITKDVCSRQKKMPISEYLFKKGLKEMIDPQLTLHSLRRGAVQTLARLGFSKIEIQELTLHNQQARKNSRQMDIYQNGLWLTDPRDINQIKYQAILLTQLELISHSTKQYLLQEWLPQQSSKLPATN